MTEDIEDRAPGWEGFGSSTPNGEGYFLIGGTAYEIDYVRWVHGDLVEPPVTAPPVSNLHGDLNGNCNLDVQDIDMIYANRGAPAPLAPADLDQDGDVDDEDARLWVEDLDHTGFSDANLDRLINIRDFGRLAGGLGYSGGWARGNFDGNESVDIVDFGQLAENFGSTYERWWDFEYDGSVAPDLARPVWNVDYTEASTDGDVLSFTSPGKWSGMSLRVADGAWNEWDSTTMEIRFKWLGDSEDGVFNYERPNQWQALPKPNGGVLQLAQPGSRPDLALASRDWNIVRFLMNAETNTIDTYIWPRGSDVGGTNIWPDEELAADHTGWGGFGSDTPKDQGHFLIGGSSYEIDYVRWVHGQLLAPTTGVALGPDPSSAAASAEFAPAGKTPVANLEQSIDETTHGTASTQSRPPPRSAEPLIRANRSVTRAYRRAPKMFQVDRPTDKGQSRQLSDQQRLGLIGWKNRLAMPMRSLSTNLTFASRQTPFSLWDLEVNSNNKKSALPDPAVFHRRGLRS